MAGFTNIKTGMVIHREEPNEKEFIYSGKPLLVETDTDGMVTYVNRRFLEVSGYTKEEIIGSPHCMHMHPGMPDAIFQDACRMTSEGKTWSGYIRNISKNGVTYWTEALIQPKTDEQGVIVGYMATRREPEAGRLEGVMEEYDILKKSGEKGRLSQYCGEIYLGRDTCQF